MPDIDLCPNRQVLERLLLGQLSADEAGALDEHLLGCERCCGVLNELVAGDSMAGAVREVSARHAPIDDRVRAAIARWKQVTLPGKAMEETLARSPEPTEDAWDLEKLLDPPEADGELGRFGGGYRVLRVLGAGGMGMVLEAEDLKLRRRVALKVMKRSLASREEHHQRFLREARAAAAIEHPHIVTVYQVGEHNGLPFMAMQLLKGEALDDRLRRESTSNKEDGLPSPSSTNRDGLGRSSSLKGVLPLAECLRIGRETAEALAEAHSRNLIHRDIKPGNIWLEGASGWVKLVDFGLAHAAEDVHLTQTGAILGTPAYMSPEQARGEAVDGRTDLYSLGAVLYKLTTGDVPFRGANTMAVLMALATETPRQPIELNPDIPPVLNDLILRLLAKNPDERFESATAVAEAIRTIEASRAASSVRNALCGVPSATLPGDAPARRRPRWPLIAAAAAACMLAAILVIVRDKDGKELARMKFDRGASAEVQTDDAADKVDPISPPGNIAATVADADIPPPVQVPEPPPLEEWLKGRTVLSVAQDGSGQFQTIQEALNALKPHQVVKVLDRGPYRESIHTGGLPDDTGLISDQQATVETLAWPDSGMGHIFGPTEKFRLAGMRFVAPPRDSWGTIVFCAEPSGLVIEDCCFGLTAALDPSRSVAGVGFALENEASDDSPIVVRDCLFDYAILSITGGAGHSTFVVERNYFRNSNVGLGNRLDRAIVRHNVFDGGKACFWIQGLSDVGRVLEISNNTAATGVTVVNGAPLRGVVLRNNITGHDVEVDEQVYKLRAEMAKNWQRDHNSYLRRPLFAKSPTDVTVEPAYLSSEPADRNYLRIPADGPQAIGGAGGDWPAYIGAFPPGPAPKEGDWFTRLRERWPSELAK